MELSELSLLLCKQGVTGSNPVTSTNFLSFSASTANLSHTAAYS
jgi:hypothetical protein